LPILTSFFLNRRLPNRDTLKNFSYEKRWKSVIAILFFLSLCSSASGQVKIQAHAGFGYIEHLAIGAGVTFANQHTVAFFYGSDFVHSPEEFSNYLIQYNWTIHRLRFANISPTVGVKGGQCIYTDDYYTWKVAVLVPFVGLQYPLSNKMDLIVQAGTSFSFEQSVKRKNFGEIGHYKELLPEAKIGIVYNLSRVRQ
jgi:hypothetical protein